MIGFLRPTAKKVGLPPGTLIHIGAHKDGRPKASIMQFGEDYFEETEREKFHEDMIHKDRQGIVWINLDGVHDVESVEAVGNFFHIHPLVLEDVVHTSQRPKMEDYENYLYVVLKMIFLEDQQREIRLEQVSLILGADFVISFQEREGDVFDPIRERIRTGKGRVRKMGADYLAYCLMDVIVDNYFAVLEKIGEDIETLQQEVLSDPGPETLAEIEDLRRELIYLRRSVWPLREAVSRMQRDETPLVSERISPFFRDIHDHTVQVGETLETFRDMVSGMIDIYLSSMSNKMNEVMKVLTIIATLFIPLTFIAGVYGMNFKHMPELNWTWGYFGIWGVMLSVAAAMILYFRRKRWF